MDLHDKRLACKLVIGAQQFKSVLLITGVLVNNEEVFFALAHDEASVELTDNLHFGEPIFSE